MIPGTPLREAQELCFHLTSVILIACSMFFNNRSVERNPMNLWIGIMLIYTLGVWYAHLMGWYIALNVILGVMTYFCVIRTVKKEDIRFICKVLVGMITFALIYRGCQQLGFDIMGISELNTGGIADCSFFGIKAAFGMYMAFIIPLLAVISLWFLLLIPFVILSYSTGAVIAGVSATMFLLWFRKRIAFWIVLIPLLYGSFMYVTKMDNPMGMQTSRIPMWGMVLQDSFKAPLGTGLDSFRQPKVDKWGYYKNSWNDVTHRGIVTDKGIAIKEKADEITQDMINKCVADNVSPLNIWDHPHNEFLLIMKEFGLPGFAIFMILLYFVWLRFWHSQKDLYTTALMASMVAFGLFSMTQFPMHLSRIGHALPIIAGLFFISTEENVN